MKQIVKRDTESDVDSWAIPHVGTVTILKAGEWYRCMIVMNPPNVGVDGDGKTPAEAYDMAMLEMRKELFGDDEAN